jgi:hypothetical protein
MGRFGQGWVCAWTIEAAPNSSAPMQTNRKKKCVKIM